MCWSSVRIGSCWFLSDSTHKVSHKKAKGLISCPLEHNYMNMGRYRQVQRTVGIENKYRLLCLISIRLSAVGDGIAHVSWKRAWRWSGKPGEIGVEDKKAKSRLPFIRKHLFNQHRFPCSFLSGMWHSATTGFRFPDVLLPNLRTLMVASPYIGLKRGFYWERETIPSARLLN